MEIEGMLTRHSPPHKYDIAPQGTKIAVIAEGILQSIYEQKSTDEDNPEWVLIESFKK